MARDNGIETVCDFLGQATGTAVAADHGQADLVAANNVFAHVPDIVDFARGLRALLKDDGTLTIEIPHLLRLIEGRLYDTIYHEHYSYLSLLTTQRVLAEAGLTVVDVEELPTHGGSLRTWSMPPEARTRRPSGWPRCSPTSAPPASTPSRATPASPTWSARPVTTSLEFLVEARRAGRSVAGYGAPGKGNTLLNHAGVREDLLAYTVDRSTFKQGMFLPGHPHPDPRAGEAGRDQAGLHPGPAWNLREEISAQLEYTREWGAQLVVPLPRLEVF